MATIRAYTTIEQSSKLADILPLESADQTWARIVIAGANLDVPKEMQYRHNGDIPFQIYSCVGIPCWSLASLLSVLPNYQLQTQDDGIGILCSYKGNFNIVTADNTVDACYEMIIKLKELNLL